MKAKGKKFVSLFLIFSLMMLSANLYAKERRGAKLIITKKDGGQIKGELIVVKVKQNSLLLLDTEGKDVSVGIADIKVIRIVKKSKALLGAGTGFLIGGSYVLLASSGDPIEDGALLWHAFWVVVFGVPLALIGGIIGAIAGIDKTIQIEGMSDLGIEQALKKLRKKARIRDYK